MFGVSTLGWVHTLSSIPAIPVAAYMLVRFGRIVPRSILGALYFVSMLIGASTVFLITKRPESHGIAAATILLLLAGYGVGRLRRLGRAVKYIETICLTMTVLLLMLPTVSEILRRVPDGHPFVTDLKSPLFLGSQAALFAMFVIGLAAQIFFMRRKAKDGKGFGPHTSIQPGDASRT